MLLQSDAMNQENVTSQLWIRGCVLPRFLQAAIGRRHTVLLRSDTAEKYCMPAACRNDGCAVAIGSNGHGKCMKMQHSVARACQSQEFATWAI